MLPGMTASNCRPSEGHECDGGEYSEKDLDWLASDLLTTVDGLSDAAGDVHDQAFEERAISRERMDALWAEVDALVQICRAFEQHVDPDLEEPGPEEITLQLGDLRQRLDDQLNEIDLRLLNEEYGPLVSDDVQEAREIADDLEAVLDDVDEFALDDETGE